MPNMISISRWRPLYELAQQIEQLKPWREMVETEIFAVQDPESKKIGTISIMGKFGQHYAIAVYLDHEGLRGFIDMQTAESQPNPTLFMSIPHLQLSFEKRSELDENDLFIFRELGYKPPGSRGWPLFRSFRPGFAPWFLENEEISFLKTVLEQTIIVLQDLSLRNQVGICLDEEKILTRKAKRIKGDYHWTSEMMPLYPPDKEYVVHIDAELMEQVRTLPAAPKQLYLDLQILLNPIQEKKGKQPYFAYLLILMDEESELILHQEMLTVARGWDDFLTELPATTLKGIQAIGYRPEALLIRYETLADLHAPIIKELKIKLINVDEMPAIDGFIQGLYDFTRKQNPPHHFFS